MRISNSTTTATTNEWPQLIEERVTLMPASHHHQHHPHHRNVSHHLHGATAPGPHSVATAGRATDNQQTLKCPRCDSTNTKFCYYNNYSLSQPRHFCKACKRYWTRGGTLRNVPVGGGCRKNKRIKKTSSTSTSAATAWAVTDPPLYLPPQISNLSLPQSSSNTVDPIFYGLHNNSAVDFSSSFLKSLEQRNLMSSLAPCTDQYDFMNSHPSSLGLCFPMNTTTTTTTAAHQGQSHKTIQFQAPDLAAALAASTAASTSLVHEYSLLGSSLSSSAAASLIAATHRQPKMEATNPPGWPTTYDDVQPDHGTLGFFKESKEEDGSNAVINHNSRLEWQIPCDNIGAVNASPSLYWPNSNAATGIGGGWLESVTNCGSSITPLI